MAGIDKYVRKAAQSKQAGFTLPVIESAEDALRVAREAAASLQTLPDDARLALLSDLGELSTAISGRIDRLQQELAITSLQLQQARFGSKVCRSYMQNGGRAPAPAADPAGVVVKLDTRRRPPCP